MSGADLRVERVRWIPNRAGLKRHMEGPEIQSALERRGRKILDHYKPKMSGASGGRWVFVEGSSSGPSVRAGTDFPFAHIDEWGSVNNPPYGSMRRAVGRAGFDYKPKSKGG